MTRMTVRPTKFVVPGMLTIVCGSSTAPSDTTGSGFDVDTATGDMTIDAVKDLPHVIQIFELRGCEKIATCPNSGRFWPHWPRKRFRNIPDITQLFQSQWGEKSADLGHVHIFSQPPSVDEPVKFLLR